MNPDSPIDPRSALESRLTALLLGELPHEESAALHQKLAQDAELAALYERLKHTINLVRETIASPAEQTADQPAPLKLSEDRRQKLLQHFKTVAPKEFARPRRRRIPVLVELGIAAALVLLLASIVVPNFTKARTSSMGSLRLMSSLSKDAESAPPMPTAGFQTYVDLNRNGAMARAASNRRVEREGVAPPPPAEAAPAPAKPAGTAIVLPKGGEPDVAASAFRSRYDWLAEPAPATRSWGINDDSSALGGGVGAGAPAPTKDAYFSTDPETHRPVVIADGDTAGYISGALPQSGHAAAGESRLPQVAASDSFFSQPLTVGAVESTRPVKNEGQIQALGEPAQPGTPERHGFSLLGPREEITAGAASASPPPTQVTPLPNSLHRIIQRAAPAPEPPAPTAPPPPITAGPAVASTPPQEAWTAGAAYGALPPPALAPSAGSPPNRLEVPSVPLETHSEVLAGVASSSRARMPSVSSTETRKGAELLREPAVAEPRPPQPGSGLAYPTGSFPGQPGSVLAANGQIKAQGGTAPSSAQETAANEAVYHQDQLLTSGLRTADTSGHQKQGDVSLSAQAGKAPAQGAESSPQTAGHALLGPPEQKALGFDWYQGNVLANAGQIKAQGGTAPPNAGQPLPEEKAPNTPPAAVELASSDTSQKGLDTTVAGGNFAVLADRKAAKEAPPKITLQGTTTLPAPDSQRQFLGAVTNYFASTPAAGDSAGKRSETLNYSTYSAGSAGQTYAFNFDARPLPGSSRSDGDQVPVLGDVPAAGRFYRLKADEVGGGATVKAEEKVNSVESAYTADQEGRKGTTESAGGGPSNVHSLNVVGYYNLTAGPQQQIFLANQLNTTSSRSLEASSSTDQKSRQFFEAKRNLEELQRFRQILDTKIASEGIEADLPKSTMVEIVDKAAAQPTQSPSLGDRIRSSLGGKVERSARIKFERDQSDITGPAERGQTQCFDPYFIQTEFERMQSEAVLGKVIDNLNLKKEWANKQGGGTLTREEALARLKKSLDLKPVPNSSLIDVGVRSDNPDEAARIANAVAEAYRDQRLEQRKELSAGSIKALEAGYAAQEQKVREAQANVDRLRRELNISDAMATGDGPSPLMTADTLRKLEALRIENHEQLALQQTLLDQLKEVKKTSGSDGLAQVLPTATGDTLLSSLLEQSAAAQQKLAALRKEYGPDHPDVLKAKGGAEELHTKITNRADAVMAALEARTTAVQKSLNDLEQEVAQATSNDTATVAQTRAYVEAKRSLQELQGVRKAAQTNQSDVAPPKPTAPAPVPQPEVQTTDNAFSTFSLNVSDVSFKLAAASLEKGVMPEPATVRSEEFINAFDYRDPEPPPGVPVGFAWERAQYPFAQNRDLLRFSIKTAAQGRQPGRPMNIVLLLDTSGSMERADRVQIIREALRVLAAQLQPQDKLSVVTFARTARLVVDGVPGSQAAQVVEEVSGLTPQGGTNLEDAMNLAYATALRHYLADGINRVVLLTDGAANLGNVDPEALKQKVEANRKQGIALDCFGVGWEGYNDDLLEVLSRNGDGRYGFINTPEEAATEFAGQLAGALHVAASDVKAQVEFNPARVTAYRQIGYAKHQLTKEQFRDNTVAAAQIGAAEAGNALYVVEVNPAGDGPLATVRVRYRVPGTSDYHEHEWSVPYTGNAVPLDQSSPAMRLAATASAFSEWLAASPYAAEVTPDRLLGYLGGVPEVYGADTRPKKLEWMLRQAKSIAGK